MDLHNRQRSSWNIFSKSVLFSYVGRAIVEKYHDLNMTPNLHTESDIYAICGGLEVAGDVIHNHNVFLVSAIIMVAYLDVASSSNIGENAKKRSVVAEADNDDIMDEKRLRTNSKKFSCRHP